MIDSPAIVPHLAIVSPLAIDQYAADSYLPLLVALLPLTAGMLIFQTNPYHALVMRGILGAVAALVYALLGAADVALTEALVGTMLSITLYAVAVRSSLVMRLGIVDEDWPIERLSNEGLSNEGLSNEGLSDPETSPAEPSLRSTLSHRFAEIRAGLKPYQVRLELVCYPDGKKLEQAFLAKDIHATCTRSPILTVGHDPVSPVDLLESQSSTITVRVQRLYDILTASCPSSIDLRYVNLREELKGPGSPLESEISPIDRRPIDTQSLDSQEKSDRGMNDLVNNDSVNSDPVITDSVRSTVDPNAADLGKK